MTRRMLKVLAMTSTIVAAAAGLTTTASASVVFLTGNHPQSGEQNILFNTGSGTTVTGHTDQSGTLVDFASLTGQTLVTSSSGQAKITTAANGGFLTDVDVTAPGFTFTDFIANLHDLQSDALVTVVTNDGTSTDTFAPHAGGGENFFTILAENGETIWSVDFGSASGFNQFQQPRISGLAAAIPELSTWAMMVVGLAGLGAAGWRKRSKSPLSIL